MSLPDADSGDSSDGARRGKGASLAVEALEEEPRGPELQIAPEDARRSADHAGRAAEAPGPAAEPYHSAGDASVRSAAEEGQGREEKQEEEEHEEIQAR